MKVMWPAFRVVVWKTCRAVLSPAAADANAPAPHSRDGQPTDFRLTLRGARIRAARIRCGLDKATAPAALLTPPANRCGSPRNQLRHTYATSRVSAGMSLQALMALLGHVSPEMTLRYASLANHTLPAPTTRR